MVDEWHKEAEIAAEDSMLEDALEQLVDGIRKARIELRSMNEYRRNVMGRDGLEESSASVHLSLPLAETLLRYFERKGET